MVHVEVMSNEGMLKVKYAWLKISFRRVTCRGHEAAHVNTSWETNDKCDPLNSHTCLRIEGGPCIIDESSLTLCPRVPFT